LLLRAEKLSKRFGGVQAVEAVDLAVEAGAVFSIIGPNGAGKTTLLNLLCGIYRADAGRIFLGEDELTGRAPHAFAAAGIGRSFQTPQIFFNMSALENVMAGRYRHECASLWRALVHPPSLKRAERASRAEAERLLAFVGLEPWANAAADAMPYGALKRLEIARALASQPKLLFLDEPAAGLNPTETLEVDDLIQRLAARGITVVLVEHNMKLVMGVSQSVLVLDYGRTLALGRPEAIRQDERVIAAYLGAEA
jgi:branched-chain amino acid transport system ATP-binding protein